jgi:hypothetical protein|uniref:Uncharacterized protein n=1 Tax=Eutreptiella gymnastica TaxID=73025 RepID=A0A6T2HEC0_9EUGL
MVLGVGAGVYACPLHCLDVPGHQFREPFGVCGGGLHGSQAEAQVLQDTLAGVAEDDAPAQCCSCEGTVRDHPEDIREAMLCLTHGVDGHLMQVGEGVCMRA